MINKTIIYDRLNLTPKKLDDFCKQHHILELSLFGSILRDDFRADSDIDILVVFNHSANPHLSLMDLVGIKYQLEEMVKREVDHPISCASPFASTNISGCRKRRFKNSCTDCISSWLSAFTGFPISLNASHTIRTTTPQ